MIDPVIDPEILAQVFRGERGMPGRCFTDPAYFEQEMEALLLGNWACIGFAHDVPAGGDLHPLTFAGVPLVLVHGADGIVRVFHNVCSHRGALLVDEPCSGLARITCPYHRWMYSLDGTLEHTHHVGGFRVHVTPEADPSELGLRVVRSALWNGFVFADVSGEAGPFADFIAPTATRLAPVDFDGLRHDPAFDGTLAVRANWKTIVENYVESYHVPQVHPELQKFNPMAAHYQILGGAAYAGQGGTAYGGDANPAPMPGADLPRMDSLRDLPFDYEGLFVFPNLVITPVSNMTFVLVLQPESAGLTLERVAFWFCGDASMTVTHAGDRQAAADAVLAVNREDIAIVESCQRGRRSPAFNGGVFMQGQEATSLLVQRMITGRLLRHLGIDVDLDSLPMMDIHHELGAPNGR